MAAPVYINRLSSQGIGELQPSRNEAYQVTGQAVARFGQALGGLGGAVMNLSQQIESINTETAKNTGYITALQEAEDLKRRYENDPDPATAEKRAQEEWTKVESKALDGLPQHEQNEQRLRMTRLRLDTLGTVRTGALKRQADTFTAGIDQQYDTFSKRYAQAQTDQERQGIVAEFDQSLTSGVSRGMMTARAQEAYKQSLIKTGDTAQILRQIGQNPAAAQAALADPEQFKGIDPTQREQLAIQARLAAEQLRTQRLEIRARINPEAAALEAGRISGERAIQRIFDTAIIPQESGGRAGAVSPAGALGIGQMMPATALGVATKHASKDPAFAEFARLPESERRERLLADPGLNRRLGQQYLQDTIEAADGSIVAGIAGYHAGTGRGIEWHRAAVAKYGEGYSAAQYLTVMDQELHDGKNGQKGKRTVDYVRDIYKRMGVDINAPAFTGMGTFRGAEIVQREFDRRDAQGNQLIKEITAVAISQANQYGGMMDNGIVVAPQRLAAIQAPLELGAARGDPQAAEALRLFKERIELMPHADRFYKMTSPDREAALGSLRSEFAKDPTPDRQRVLKVLESVHANATKAEKEAPIQLMERQRLAEPTFVNPQAQTKSPELASQLQARSLVSDQAFRQYGTQAFFKPEEGRAWQERFQQMGENEKFELMEATFSNTGSKGAFTAAMREISNGDSQFMLAATLYQTRPEISRQILRGQALMKIKGMEPAAKDIHAAAKGVMPTLPYPGPVVAQLLDASVAVFVANKGANAAMWDPADRAGIEAAIRSVTGPMPKINGRLTPLPEGVAEWQVTTLMSAGLLDKTLDSVGGAYGFDNRKFDAAFIGRHGRLKPVDDRIGAHQKYQIVLPAGNEERPLRTKDGQILVVDLPKLVQQHMIDQEQALGSAEFEARRLNRVYGGTNRPPREPLRRLQMPAPLPPVQEP